MTRAVVHLVEELGLGGMERVIQRLARAQRQSGWEVRVLCTCAGGLVADQMDREQLSVTVLGLNSFHWMATVPSLARLLRPFRPFFLHTHGAVRAAGRVAGRLAGADAIIHHLHGTESYRWRQRVFEQSFPADAYLACSGAVLDQFQRGVGNLPVEVLYNPVDTDQYRSSHDLHREGRRLLGISDDRPIILTIGRFVPEKGQGCLMDAIPSVLDHHPNALFVFIGDGPEREKIEQRGTSHHGSVRFLGRQIDPLPYLNACDLYVQPSLGREGLGLAVLEAMACEKSVVATGVQGLPEAVGRDGTGVLVPPGDSDALSKAIRDLLDHPKERKELGLRARERVLSLFSLKVVSNSLEKVYRRISGK